MPRGEEFRKRALECYRLSTKSQHPEHRSIALDLAKAWTRLAEHEELKALAQNAAAREETAADTKSLIIARSKTDRPEEPIE
jgi:hypothetical protein